MADLSDIPLTQLKGVGNKLADVLAKLHLHDVQDLLFHLPSRYEDRTRVIPISQFRAGMYGLFEAEVIGHRIVMGRRRSLEVQVKDTTGKVSLRFFHFSGAQVRQLDKGRMMRLYGEARLGRTGLEFYHPEYQLITGDDQLEVPDTLTPIYPLTDGIQQPRMRALCKQALTYLDQHHPKELLPTSVLTEFQLPDLSHAIKFLHEPPASANQTEILEGKHLCQRRLILEELLAHHVSLLQLRGKIREQSSMNCALEGRVLENKNAFLQSLPFKLTNAQQRVEQEISKDLASNEAMLRLVQGDVGSGKTVVAACAAIQASQHNFQTAMMAPTEILAEQHYQNFVNWLEPMGFKVGWLSGKSKGKQRQETLVEIAEGRVNVIVGTHALFQEEVKFKHLALAIIDEQHRFGVHQRLALKHKGSNGQHMPHQLIMTATPIPRTLAMSAYADLDTSIIDERPPGRQEIDTFVLPDSRRDEMVDRVSAICEQGNQAYWVCTLIEDSEALQCQAAEDTCAWLQTKLPNLLVGLVHGRMKANDKASIMEAFASGKIDLLVATTVIEVGVDVPNATLMVIENPERLGLAQLHQLRGRVGRGSEKSYCALMYHPPLSENGKQRLNVMRESNDGFVIAEKDLEIRGPGEVLGTKQTGLVSFKVADIQRDKDLLEHVRGIAPKITQTKALMERWLKGREQYAEV